MEESWHKREELDGEWLLDMEDRPEQNMWRRKDEGQSGPDIFSTFGF